MYILKRHKQIRVFEAFAGYGGASFGLRRSGVNHRVIGFSEINPDAIELYQYNFPGIKNFGSITEIKDLYHLPNFDMFCGGFPCQPFSAIGKGQGEGDVKGRGTMFQEIIRICEIKQPRYILLENVTRLMHGKFEETFKRILSELRRIGYDVRYAVLNSKDYGVPQSRERLWIFAYRGDLPITFNLIPDPIVPHPSLSLFLDEHPSEDLYRTPEQVARLKEVHHVQSFAVDRPTCFDIYNHSFRKDDCCMTVTPPEHNVVRIVEPPVNGVERVRKLSINEHFRLMGFCMTNEEQEIVFPETQTYRKLGERAGNGWDVNLVGILLNHIFWQLL